MKNSMRSRIIWAMAVTLLAATLTACRSGSPSQTEAPVQTETAASSAQTEQAEEAAEKPYLCEARDIPSIELVKEMKIGWNLGNTLDAVIQNPTGEESPIAWEIAWGQPLTTKPMIDRVAAGGFNVLRIPVTWDGKFGEAPDYTIREDWMERVQQIADWGLENDMFVIINLHHEEWNYPDDEHAEEAEAITRALWGQIADHFAEYNEKLIFEGMNEPRLKNTPMEWNGGTERSREIINQWNAAFVETVRSKGGNNAKRHLMIPGYAASSSEKVLEDIVVPDDDKVIVSVHAYLPYTFALAEPENAVDTWSADNKADTRDIDTLMVLLKTMFIDKGQAVIIGEFGTRNRFNTDDRAACAGYYISRASEIGVPCVWWDNNAYVSGEAFGLFDRSTFEWRYPQIISAMNDALDEKSDS